MLIDDINYRDTENGIGEVSYLAIRSTFSFKSDQSSCFDIAKSEKGESLF